MRVMWTFLGYARAECLLTDDMLRALAKNGGVIGICFGMGFINPKDAEGLRSATETEADAPSLTGGR